MIICGDAQRIPLADETVQCVVTSPPYWGLRDYGLPPSVWGGKKRCAHEWASAGELKRTPDRSSGDYDAYGHGVFVDRIPRGEQAAKSARGQTISLGDFCRCGAWLGLLGLEPSPELYVQHIVEIFREVRRVLKPDGTLWLNLGDSYHHGPKGNSGELRPSDKQATNAGSLAVRRGPGLAPNRQSRIPGLKPKDLVGIPWRVAFALQADGWWLRSDIIWSKQNPMPESVQGSHYSRHMVTIEEYERLSGLRYFDECAGADWAGDMPNLSEREVSSRKAPLSAESQGASHCPSPRNAGRCKREAAAVQSLAIWTAEQSQVRGNREGQGESQAGSSEVQNESTREGTTGTTASSDEGLAGAPVAAQDRQQEVPTQRQGSSVGATATRTEARRGALDGTPTDSGGLGGNPGGTQAPLLLLQKENETDDGPCDPAEEGRGALEGECGPGLHSLQFKEERFTDSPLLVGCPGCPKCIKHHGYTFHLSAGRPTKAHEYIFLLAKSERYFFNQDAVCEPYVSSDEHRESATWVQGWASGNGSHSAIDHAQAKSHKGSKFTTGKTAVHQELRTSEKPRQDDPGGRNIRTVWTIATEPYSGAHFATFPQKLVEPCILAGSRPGDLVLDPFGGTGTVGRVAERLSRRWVCLDLKYHDLAEKRTTGIQKDLSLSPAEVFSRRASSMSEIEAVCSECHGTKTITVDNGSHVDLIPCPQCTPKVFSCAAGHPSSLFQALACPACASFDTGVEAVANWLETVDKTDIAEPFNLGKFVRGLAQIARTFKRCQ